MSLAKTAHRPSGYWFRDDYRGIGARRPRVDLAEWADVPLCTPINRAEILSARTSPLLVRLASLEKYRAKVNTRRAKAW